MPDDPTSALPPSGGTDSGLPPQAPGTDAGAPSSAAETEPDHPAYHTLKKRFNDVRSQSEQNYIAVQRLAAERDQLRQMLSQTQHAPREEQRPPGDLYADFSDGVIDRDPRRIHHFAETIKQQAKAELVNELSSFAGEASRTESSNAFIRRELKPGTPLTQAAVERYREIANDPEYLALVPPAQVAVGNGVINPHLMRFAILEAKAKVGSQLDAADDRNRASSEHFTEPAGRAAAPKKATFNPKVHLSEREREYVDKNASRGITYASYWKSIEKHEPEKARARLERGRPVSNREI